MYQSKADIIGFQLVANKTRFAVKKMYVKKN